MPSGFTQHLLVETLYAFRLEKYFSAMLLVAYILVGIALWRLWVFTIAPRMRKGEPSELSYWIPGQLRPPKCLRITGTNTDSNV